MVKIKQKLKIRLVIDLLSTGSEVSKENAVAALGILSLNVDNREVIRVQGGIKPLIQLLLNGSEKAKLDVTTYYSVCLSIIFKKLITKEDK